MTKSNREQTNLQVIVTIPCFNTRSFIGDVVSRAGKYVDKIVVIDDGSQDGTADEAIANGALVVNHKKNKGYGASIKSCFEAAKTNNADILVILDGDGQNSPEDIRQLLPPIIRGEADLVIGSRFLKNKGNVPRYRRFGIGIITFLWNFGSKARVTDSQSGFRAYNKNALKSICLTESGMGASIEVLEIVRRKGLNIVEVPISCRYFSSSINLKSITHGLSVAFSTMRIRLKYQFVGINK